MSSTKEVPSTPETRSPLTRATLAFLSRHHFTLIHTTWVEASTPLEAQHSVHTHLLPTPENLENPFPTHLLIISPSPQAPILKVNQTPADYWEPVRRSVYFNQEDNGTVIHYTLDQRLVGEMHVGLTTIMGSSESLTLVPAPHLQWTKSQDQPLIQALPQNLTSLAIITTMPYAMQQQPRYPNQLAFNYHLVTASPRQ